MIKSILTALLIALCIRTVLFQPFTIPSGSMEPTVLPGDYVIIEKFAYGYSRFSLPLGPPLFHGRIFERAPHRGDIVVFKLPRDNHTDYIKRLIGLPGDRIEVEDGVVYVNGRPIAHQPAGQSVIPGPYGLPQPVDRVRETLADGKSYVTYHFEGGAEMENTGVYVVPAHEYFFMGDNRDNSSDSRYPGAIGVGYVPEENLVGKAALVAFSWKPDVSIFKPWTWITDLRFGRLFHLLH
jgi:signal peptidase I